jgi:pimeloyl-ACP methyl ester carboxylesterase
MDKAIKLPDGRQLSFAEYGVPHGKPVFFFHGTPSSRYLRYPDDTLTESLGVRLITIDRPGFGLSDPLPNRKLLDWPGDVQALADSLKIDEFVVAGISGGGPYVSACAYKLPHRITRAGIISGGGPTDEEDLYADMYPERKMAVKIARSAPWLLKPLIGLTHNPQRNIEKYFQGIVAKSCQSDQGILNRPEMKSLMKKNWLEGTRQGVGGFVRDGIIMSLPWGFRLEDIQVPVHIWHGDADTSIPLVMAQYIADRIPGCRLTVYPGEGHFLLFDHWEEILTSLTRDE